MRDDVEKIVRGALNMVGSFPDGEPIEDLTFERFHPYHKQVFLWSIKTAVTAWRIDENRHYNIGLNENDINNWANMKICIDWLNIKKRISISNTKLLT